MRPSFASLTREAEEALDALEGTLTRLAEPLPGDLPAICELAAFWNGGEASRRLALEAAALDAANHWSQP